MCVTVLGHFKQKEASWGDSADREPPGTAKVHSHRGLPVSSHLRPALVLPEKETQARAHTHARTAFS